MKYRITEHQNGNDKTHYTVEFLHKGILWGESWRSAGDYVHPKMYNPTKFTSIAAAEEYVNSQNWTTRIVKEGKA
jgi:hypothetical protein